MHLTAAEFNAKYPIGTEVEYYPIIGRDEFKLTKTTSEAWNIGESLADRCADAPTRKPIPLVCVEGITGGVWLKALKIPRKAKSCQP